MINEGSESRQAVLCVALPVERLAVRPAAATMHVLTVGMGARRPCISLLAAGRGPLIVAGVAGALVDGVRPGDLVVADSLLPPATPIASHGAAAGASDRARVVPGSLLPKAVGLPKPVGLPKAEGARGRRRIVPGSLQQEAPGAEPGDPLVPIPVPGAAALAGALRLAGLTVHVGPLAAAPALVHGVARRRLARGGAIAVDMESYRLAALAPGRRLAVVRAVVDTPQAPLRRPGTAARGIVALRSLRRAVPVIERWAGTGHASPLAQEVV